MKHRAGLALLALALPLLAPQVAHAASGEPCLQHPMQTLPGIQWQFPEAVAAAGRFVVGDAYREGVGDTIIRWHDGVVAEIGVTDAQGLSVKDVSDDGQIVYYRNGPNASFRYRDGNSEQLPTPAGWATSQVSGIDNTRGIIIGRVLDADQTTYRAVSWDTANRARLLALPPGFTESSAAEVAPGGTIVGTVTDWSRENPDDYHHRAVLWRPDGTVTLLPKAATARDTDVYSIHSGRIVGYQDRQLVTWQFGSADDPTPLGTLAPQFTSTNGTVLYPNDTIAKSTGEVRPLERIDTGTASNLHPLGVTYDDQVLGWDDFTQEPVRWDCS